MPATTPVSKIPYPVGTDRVADGDNAMQAIAMALDGLAWVTLALSAGWTGSIYWARRSNVCFILSNASKSSAITNGELIATLPANGFPSIPAGGILLLVGQGAGVLRTMTLDAAGALKAGENASTAMSPWGHWAYPAANPQT
jgi:hypothetical protein